MKGVMTDVPAHILEWRRRTGADRFDEMWEGVMHMTPSPNREHQDLAGALESWLRVHWVKTTGCRVYREINIAEPGTWPENYRVPDLVMLTPARSHIDLNTYFEGGPDAVVEIRSPEDETYEKLGFYAKVGVREFWIIDRDSKRLELLELNGDEFLAKEPDSDGWLRSLIVGAEMRPEDGKLAIRFTGRPETFEHLP